MSRAKWMSLAACRGMDPEAFFPHREDRAGRKAAKAVCCGCDVQSQCLAYALDKEIDDGVFGGLAREERRAMRKAAAAAAENARSARKKTWWS